MPNKLNVFADQSEITFIDYTGILGVCYVCVLCNFQTFTLNIYKTITTTVYQKIKQIHIRNYVVVY